MAALFVSTLSALAALVVGNHGFQYALLRDLGNHTGIWRVELVGNSVVGKALFKAMETKRVQLFELLGHCRRGVGGTPCGYKGQSYESPVEKYIRIRA